MTDLERVEIRTRVKAMTSEELELVIKTIGEIDDTLLNDEYKRRNDIKDVRLSMVQEAFRYGGI